MAVISRVVTLAVTPTLIEVGSSEGKTVLMRDASAIVFLGGADVTISNGFRLLTTDILSITLLPGDQLWMVASTGTPTVGILATRDGT